MNKWTGIGRLTNGVVLTVNGELSIARYTLACDRKVKKEGDQTADFINCVAFGKSADFADKYFKQGMKVAVVGRIQTGSYTNKEGKKVYTTDVIIEEQEFCEKKTTTEKPQEKAMEDGFIQIPDGVDDTGLPF